MAYYRTISYGDLEAVTKREDEEEWPRQIANEFAIQTMRGSVLAASSHRYSLLEELIWAAYVSRHPKGANYLAVELIVLKEMAQALADLFGLRLPVIFKKNRKR